MDETEQRIIQLAEIYERPKQFIDRLEKAYRVPLNEKGDFFLRVGIILYRYSYFALALNSWNYALKYFIKNDDKWAESRCYGNLAIAYHSLGDFRKAIEYLEKSLEIAKEIGDKDGEAKTYGNLGNVYNALGDFGKAIEYLEKSLETAKEIGDRNGEATCYTNLGSAYGALGNIGKAIEYHEKELSITKDIGQRARESDCYNNLGYDYYSLGDFRRAIEYYEKSLQIVQDIGDRHGEATCYRNLGAAYGDLGDLVKAIAYLENSLDIAKEIGDRDGEATCYSQLGVSYHKLGEFAKAIEYYAESLEIAKEIGDKDGESVGYGNLGIGYYSLGEFRKAIEYQEKSLQIAKGIGKRAGVSVCYLELSNVYYSLGDFRKSIDYLSKSLDIAKEIGDRAGESRCYTNLGNDYYQLGDFRKSIEYLKKSLEIAKEIGDRQEEANCYRNLGSNYSTLQDSGAEIECYEKSLQIAREIGDRAGESNCYRNLGTVYHRIGEFRKAADYLENALTIQKELGSVDAERFTNLIISTIYYKEKPELAYDYCKRSIELLEMIGGKLVEEENKIGFYGRGADAYQLMVPLCLRLRKEKEAFAYTERSKSKAFRDLIAASQIRPSVELTSELKSLLDDEENSLTKLREIQTRHIRPTGGVVEPGEVANILENLNLVYEKIEEFDPEYVFMRRGKPVPLKKIQDMLSSEKRNVVVIEYFRTEKETVIFVVSSKDRQLHLVPVPISTEKLNQFLEDYRREVVDYPDFKDIGDTWLSLSDYLIEPISEFLAEGDLIYFVPYGVLHYLPMHALELRGEPLIKKHPVAYAPSASLMQFCRNKGSGKLQSCASFGVVFKEESEDVAELFNTEAYDQATKDTVRENCTDKDVIHFSCHGYFDDVDPLSSGVKLYDEVLTAREIFDMRFNTELVTLSACQTGLNKRSPGDELIGLTRAFLYAGSPSVIVSLWSVDARSTQELMLEFYTLLKNGSDKATALQEAQKRIMEKKGYSHPYYWAPFVLVGDWELRR